MDISNIILMLRPTSQYQIFNKIYTVLCYETVFFSKVEKCCSLYPLKKSIYHVTEGTIASR